MPGDARKFQESINHELAIVKDRVRNLIGNANWGEEGRFKEAVLKNVLRQFLPKNLSVGSGFVLKAIGNNDTENILSTQLDIIVYDNTLPLLFSEGDLIITTPSNVRAIVEVKSKLNANTLRTTVEKFDQSILGLVNDLFKPRRKLFTGIFAFEYDGSIDSPTIDDCLNCSSRVVNHITLGGGYFIKLWKQNNLKPLPIYSNCTGDFYNIYQLENLAFSYFISNLIDITSGGLKDRYWFSYPIENTKEGYKLRSVCLDRYRPI